MFKYYLSIYREAWERTYALANGQGLFVAALAAGLGITFSLGYGGHPTSVVSLTEQMFLLALSGILPIALLVFVIFNFQVLRVPVARSILTETRINELKATVNNNNNEIKNLRKELNSASRRVVALAQRLPPPEIKDSQRHTLQSALQKFGPRTILIEYLDSPTARADSYAWRLTEIFRAALWHVEIRGVGQNSAKIEGMHMRVEAIDSMTKDQKFVHDLLTRAQFLRGLIPGRNVADRIEIEIGEM